jgi:hypothetical protein
MEEIEEVPPPTQRHNRLRAAAVQESPLNKELPGANPLEELSDPKNLAAAVEAYIGANMYATVKELLAAPDPNMHYPVILRYRREKAVVTFH